jgi:hypothetical protein
MIIEYNFDINVDPSSISRWEERKMPLKKNCGRKKAIGEQTGKKII